jgi:endonuclease/exonuclease/phosphatase (EEP) superfamily protein YafD
MAVPPGRDGRASEAALMGITVGWIVIGVLTVASASRLARVHGNAAVAVAHDALPIALLAAWLTAPLAVLAGRLGLAVLCGVLALYHLSIVVPRLRRNDRPHWVERAPRVVLGVANVFVGNHTPLAAARQLVECGADVLVVLETTPRFRAVFDRVGGGQIYPHRVFDPDDHSAYAVSIYSRKRPDRIEMVSLGELRAASVVLPSGSTRLHVLGVITTAVVEAGGYRSWHRQITALADHVPSVHEPLVVAGDLNTTTLRPTVNRLLAAGLVDAHDSLGQGLKASFKLAARGFFSRVGPLVRLDHALSNRRVHAVEVRDLYAAGSDHHPFLVTLAVRPSRAEWGHHLLPGAPATSAASV